MIGAGAKTTFRSMLRAPILLSAPVIYFLKPQSTTGKTHKEVDNFLKLQGEMRWKTMTNPRLFPR
jgi:hypothetical protein